jgi:hypothetical protein
VDFRLTIPVRYQRLGTSFPCYAITAEKRADEKRADIVQNFPLFMADSG